MEVELVLDDIERLVKNIRTFTAILKDMQKVVDELEHIKPKKEKKSKKTQTPLADLKPVEAEVPEALVCEPIKKSKKMRKPKLERS